MKKIAFILALVMVFAVALVACDETPAESSNPVTESTPAESTPVESTPDEESVPAESTPDESVQQKLAHSFLLARHILIPTCSVRTKPTLGMKILPFLIPMKTALPLPTA